MEYKEASEPHLSYQLYEIYKTKQSDIFPKDISEDEIFMIESQVSKVLNQNNIKQWKILLNMIQNNGFTSKMRDESSTQLIMFVISVFGETENENFDYIILRTISTLLCFSDPQIESYDLIQFINKLLTVVEKTTKKSMIYEFCNFIYNIIPYLIKCQYEITNDQIFDTLFHLSFKWSIDPTFKQNDIFLCIGRVLQYFPLDNDRYDQIIALFLSKLQTTSDWNLQCNFINGLEIISTKNDEKRKEILTCDYSKHILQSFTMQLDPIQSPAVCKSLCSLFSTLVKNEEDGEHFDGFDVVGRFKDIISTTNFDLVSVVLDCFANLATFSNYARMRVLTSNIIQEKLCMDTFCVKESFVNLLRSVMRDPFCDELMISNDIVETVVYVAESSHSKSCANALYVLYYIYTHGYEGQIELDLEELAESEDDEISQISSKLIDYFHSLEDS